MQEPSSRARRDGRRPLSPLALRDACWASPTTDHRSPWPRACAGGDGEHLLEHRAVEPLHVRPARQRSQPLPAAGHATAAGTLTPAMYISRRAGGRGAPQGRGAAAEALAIARARRVALSAAGVASARMHAPPPRPVASAVGRAAPSGEGLGGTMVRAAPQADRVHPAMWRPCAGAAV